MPELLPPNKGRPIQRRGPSGPAAQAPASMVQEGYDEAEGLDYIVAASPGAIVPRNVAGDPLQVVLDGVTPGNVLEVDYRATIARVGADYLTNFDLIWVPVVTFDGSLPIVPSPATFYVDNTSGGGNQTSLTTPFEQKFTLTALGNCPIPDGATKATVELFYIGSSFVLSGLNIVPDESGATLGLGATLKVTEYVGDVVTQPGPGKLTAT